MPAPKKREPKRTEEALAPEWMLTLGDCISLLLTFFVLLISFSSLNNDQLMAVMGVVQGALGAVKIDAGPDAGMASPEREADSVIRMADLGDVETGSVDASQLSSVQLDRVELKKQFDMYRNTLATIGSPVSLTLAEVEDGLVIRLGAAALFDAENRLTAAAAEALGHVAELAANVGNEIRLVDCTISPSAEGSNRPAMSWGSRIRRAREVGRQMADAYGFSGSRFGYGARVARSGEEPAFEVMLMDKIGVREVSLQDLWAAAEPAG
jgi:hypothetical protein